MATCTECKKRFDDSLEACPHDGSALLPDDMVAAADATLPPGTKLGEYVIESKIGEGAYGAVYAAEHPVIGKRAAIKVLNKKYASDLGIVSRFVTEARAVNRIRHPNIVDIFAIGQHGDQHFLAMELLEGVPLERHLKQRGPLPFAEALAILRGVAEALDAAHQHGIVHRDLKPDNVFLVRDLSKKEGGYRPKLLDFGVAKLHGEGDLLHKTATGIAIGTPFYMSPEQCRGKKVDFASDIYALGAMTYQMLTGVPPFDGESVMDILMKHMNEDPEPMSRYRPELGGMLDAAVATMLAKKPRARPASAGAAIELLAGAAATSPGTLLDEANRLGVATAPTIAARTPVSLPATTSAVATGERPTVRPAGGVSPELAATPARAAHPSAEAPASTSAAGAMATAVASSERDTSSSSLASTGSTSGMVPKSSTLGPMSSASHARPAAIGLRVGIGIGVAVASVVAFLILRTPSGTSTSPSTGATSAPNETTSPPTSKPAAAPSIVVEPTTPASASPAAIEPVAAAPSPSAAAAASAVGPRPIPRGSGASPAPSSPKPPATPSAKPPAPSAKPPAPSSKPPGNGLLDNRD
jgi:serine/threonine protein kinase